MIKRRRKDYELIFAFQIRSCISEIILKFC